eukprot:jgi/Ulvmu1/8800/UM048_0055.1
MLQDRGCVRMCRLGCKPDVPQGHASRFSVHHTLGAGVVGGSPACTATSGAAPGRQRSCVVVSVVLHYLTAVAAAGATPMSTVQNQGFCLVLHVARCVPLHLLAAMGRQHCATGNLQLVSFEPPVADSTGQNLTCHPYSVQISSPCEPLSATLLPTLCARCCGDTGCAGQ